jgi:hypothetical protein
VRDRGQLCAAAAGAVAAGEPLATVLAPYASTSQEKTRRSASLDLQEVERETMSPPKVMVGLQVNSGLSEGQRVTRHPPRTNRVLERGG